MENLNKWLVPILIVVVVAFVASIWSLSNRIDSLALEGSERSAGQTRISGLHVLSDGLEVDGTSQFDSDVTITTTNTATSSVTVGCIDTHATSTETAVRLSATSTAAGGTSAMFVFGSCSDL